MIHHPPLETWCFEARPESHLALEHKLALEDTCRIWEENSHLLGTAQILHLSLEWLHHDFDTFTAVYRPVGVTAHAYEEPARVTSTSRYFWCTMRLLRLQYYCCVIKCTNQGLIKIQCRDSHLQKSLIIGGGTNGWCMSIMITWITYIHQVIQILTRHPNVSFSFTSFIHLADLFDTFS